MTGPGDERKKGEAPRTDLPPEKDPYYEGTFGTDGEEGVVRERQGGGEKDGGSSAEDAAERARRRAEDAAGGDREI